ncbi:MAG: protein translocase subunit SecD [Fibrobacteria bacterium]|nr:protein translocase subunit SecD [Fibrobacteria bacterium]
MKQKYGFRILVAAIVALVSLWTLWPSYRILSKPLDYDKPIHDQRRANFIKENPEVANKSINLGLDLAGGTHIIVEIDDSKMSTQEREDVQDRCLEILRNRVDQYGLSEPMLSKSGDNRIVAELAGLNADKARHLIGATALLEFKLVAEVTDFKPALDRIDNYMKRQSGLSVDSSSDAPDSIKAITDIFGQVVEAKNLEEVTETTDTLSDTAVSATEDDIKPESAEVFSSRPFGAMLIAMPGGGIGVNVEDERKVKDILRRKDIQDLIPRRYQFLWARETEMLKNGVVARELYFLKRRAEMTGKYVSDARVQRAQTGEIEVSLTFKGKGPKEFSIITGANIKRRLAIVLDSVVYSAPVIQGKITQGRASITGIGEFEEAKLLATTLRAGSLPAPMQIIELRSVGPTLGLENIKKGLMATLLGLALVVVFMLIYYLGSGFVAVGALILNLIIIGAVLSMAHATLTLPGIAGIILTIGMAVDANVIIFERIREELRIGKSIRGAIDAGYKRAFTTIFDSNVTTFGTALILYYIGTGPIKGFGLTLMIGIAASMFTALFVTRLVFDIFIEKVNPKALSIGQGVKSLLNPKFLIIPKTKIFVILSAIVIIGSLSISGVKGFNWGIDFTGGNVYQVKFNSTPDIPLIRKAVEEAGLTHPKIQSVGVAADNQLLISIEKSDNDSLTKAAIQSAVGEALITGEEAVGPRIGNELKKNAVYAFVFALILIVLYIWVRFGKNGLGFGLAAVVAIFHDVLVTIGIFEMMGLELSLTFVAAVLTIIGYSLNDTIVVFDRVRENIEISGREGFASKVNTAINQSLSRTLITSVTTLFVVIILAIFGGAGIQGFAIAMIIGVVVGTYSSMCVASPFVVWWANRSLAGISTKKTKK